MLKRILWAVIALAILGACGQSEDDRNSRLVQAFREMPGHDFARSNAEAKMELCDTLAETAEVVMEARQDGIPLRRVMEIMTSNTASQEIALMAWDQPRYDSLEGRQVAISDFADNIQMICLRVAGE